MFTDADDRIPGRYKWYGPEFVVGSEHEYDKSKVKYKNHMSEEELFRVQQFHPANFVVYLYEQVSKVLYHWIKHKNGNILTVEIGPDYDVTEIGLMNGRVKITKIVTDQLTVIDKQPLYTTESCKKFMDEGFPNVVPKEFRTKDWYMHGYSNKKLSIHDIPEMYQTQEMWDEYIKSISETSPWLIYVPKQFYSDVVCEWFVRTAPRAANMGDRWDRRDTIEVIHRIYKRIPEKYQKQLMEKKRYFTLPGEE